MRSGVNTQGAMIEFWKSPAKVANINISYLTLVWAFLFFYLFWAGVDNIDGTSCRSTWLTLHRVLIFCSLLVLSAPFAFPSNTSTTRRAHVMCQYFGLQHVSAKGIQYIIRMYTICMYIYIYVTGGSVLLGSGLRTCRTTHDHARMTV